MIENYGKREGSNTVEDARGSGDDQSEGDGEESVLHLQPDGKVPVAYILIILK